MKSVIVIFSLLFSFVGWAETFDEYDEGAPLILVKDEYKIDKCKIFKEKEDISQCDELGDKVEVSNCKDYNRYSFDGYQVKDNDDQLLLKANYLHCSLFYGQDVAIEELNQAIEVIYNNKLSVQAFLETVRGSTPKELLLEVDTSNAHIEGSLIDEYHDKENIYISISVKKKISNNLYLVWVNINAHLGTLRYFNEYIFNTETKEYKDFYLNFTPTIN